MATTKEVPITNIERLPADENHEYPQVVVDIMTNDGVMKGYANQGKWNEGWSAGTKVKADVEMKTSKSTGNKYFKLSCPEELKPKGNFGGGGSGEKLLPILTEIRDELRAIKQGLEKADTAMPEPMPVDNMPTGEPKINVDDIPF